MVCPSECGAEPGEMSVTKPAAEGSWITGLLVLFCFVSISNGNKVLFFPSMVNTGKTTHS